jgi:hypothetical protein
MMSARPPDGHATRTPGWLPVLLAPLLVVAAAVLINPWVDVPVLDDWTYAWSVAQLLKHGQLRVLDWSSTYLVTQTVWGALWAWWGGPLFATLRLSTLALAIICSVTLYALLRELRTGPWTAALGTLGFIAYPVFLFLAHSFMTDVPFVTVSLLALLFHVRTIGTRRMSQAWWAAIFACAAFLVRPLGLLIPVAGLPLLWLTRGDRPLRRRLAIPTLVAWVIMLTLGAVLRHQMGVTGVMAQRSQTLRFWWLVTPVNYFRYNLDLLTVVSFALLPLACLVRPRIRRGWWRVTVVAMLAAVACGIAFGHLPIPLQTTQTWSSRQLGSVRTMIQGPAEAPPVWWVGWLLGCAALASAGIVIVRVAGNVAGAMRDLWRVDSGVRHAAAPQSSAAAAASDHFAGGWQSLLPLLVFLAAYGVAINLLWLYNDRYYLPMLPILIAVALAGQPDAETPFRLATVAVVVAATIGIAGTRDALVFTRECARERAALVTEGVPTGAIDAGYPLSGWFLYARGGGDLPHSGPPPDVPYITADRESDWILSTAPLHGYQVVRERHWREFPWPGDATLMTLHRTINGM